MGFEVKDSGKRAQFAGGMVRDTDEGKLQWHRLFDGPLAERYVAHLTKGAQKYPDVEPGVPNWMLAQGPEELQRARQSAVRHLAQWLRGDEDEDHAMALVFNINVAEYVKDRLSRDDAIVARLRRDAQQGYGDKVPAPEDVLPLDRGKPLGSGVPGDCE